jgi:hypothetical protein
MLFLLDKLLYQDLGTLMFFTELGFLVLKRNVLVAKYQFVSDGR